ncbi:MAG: hypothetical protein NUV49_00560 [Patescibacteria group bacterium]|nr:hypothetical protein [Patescibacteria group bacterium]
MLSAYAEGGTRHAPLKGAWRRVLFSSTRRTSFFSSLCAILKIVRTHFAACGGEEPPANSEWL